MLIGPVFTREAVVTPRREKFYLYRAIYVAVLFILLCTAWLILAGTQVVRNIGDMARFGSILFQILTPLQLALAVFFSALLAASAVSQEKDRKTLILLLMTRLTNSELVLGKMLASLLIVLVVLAAGLPVFMMTALFGGVSFAQVARIFVVTVASALVAGSLGSTFALWREKTFQTLAMTALTIVFWLGAWEAVYEGLLGEEFFGVSSQAWAEGFSPLRAVLAAARPSIHPSGEWAMLGGSVNLYILFAAAAAAAVNGLAIWRVRIWNPSNEIRRGQSRDEPTASIWGVEHDLAREPQDAAKKEGRAESARQGHVDSQLRTGARAGGKTREVWDNPVLWREVRTRAYGRKIFVVYAGYLLLLVMAAAGLYGTIQSESLIGPRDEVGTQIPAAAYTLVPFILVSLVIINALAVTAITTERDGRSLDLLLATDLTPKEFLLGKIGGVLWVTIAMSLAPIALSIFLWQSDGINAYNLAYLLIGILVMDLFVAMLGIHCGMTYANSRTAISVSLGTVFFLALGVATCILMMISFRGAFEGQLPPFLAFILGGSVGLFVTLGARNPSPAIGTASLLLPIATFYASVGFLVDKPLGVFVVVTGAYGLAIAAMMVPALGQFDIAMGRTSQAEE